MDRPDFAPVLDALVDRIGRPAWIARMAELKRGLAPTYAGRALAQAHALEFAIERLRRARSALEATELDQRIVALAAGLLSLADQLSGQGQARLDAALAGAISGAGNLVALFHLVRTAALQRRRGFAVQFAGLKDGAPYDLLIAADGLEVEIVCDVISAEDGRDLHRRAWSQLMDRVDPDLQDWLSAHPGRYLLKMTLPQGLKDSDESGHSRLADLHSRITRMLSTHKRADHDEAAILRLDPLMLAAAQMGPAESGLMPRLRREFGPEAHLAVKTTSSAVLVMAARAGREDEVAAAVHRRMAEIAPRALSGTRPGILAMFIEDTDRVEWFALRDQLRLEGEARHFMTRPQARHVVAISCASRLELLAQEEPCVELRFRNPGHKDAKLPGLAAVVASQA